MRKGEGRANIENNQGVPIFWKTLSISCIFRFAQAAYQLLPPKEVLMVIRFEMNEDKAIEVLTWLANEQPGVGAFHVSKVLYYADKEHLNRFGRPVMGDTYIRMEYGPVPSKTYDLIKAEKLELGVLKKFREAVDVRGGFWRLHPLRAPDMEMLSRTDLECLSNALNKYGTRDFGVLSRISHRETAWAEAPENGPMDYEHMIEQGPNQKEIIQNLKEHSHQFAF